MVDYRYCLVRYVPNLERMEPINVGVILQGHDRTEVRFSPHAAKRSDVDTAAFGHWKKFFLQELNADEPLFQPPKNTPEFLLNLQNLAQGPIVLSQPLVLSAAENRTFDEIHQSLLQRLVMPPDVSSNSEDLRPTGRFRRRAEERNFLKRGMKRYAHVAVDSGRRWIAYRQAVNGEFIAMDKVEIGRELGRTSDEIEKVFHITDLLSGFLGTTIEQKPTRYILLADHLNEPFSEQGETEFQAMQDDLRLLTEQVAKRGGEVIRTPERAEALADELDEKLPVLATP
jgi:hypothetical protein